MLHNERGRYEQCPGCKAPIPVPSVPPDWSIDLIKRGPKVGLVTVSVMPHRPGCIMQPIRFGDDEGVAIRIPGAAVAVVEYGDRDRWAGDDEPA